MAKSSKRKTVPEVSEESVDAEKAHEFIDSESRSIWMRGLIMIIFAIFFGIAEMLLAIAAIIQFLWMLFSKEPNQSLADFGVSLGKWLERVAQFQAGATEKLPFPWSDWE